MSNTCVVCSHCWAFLRASKMLLGKRVHCPKCKQKFTVLVLLKDDLTVVATRPADTAGAHTEPGPGVVNR